MISAFNIKNKKIFYFYVLACLFSWPFFWLRDMHSDFYKGIQIFGFLKTWLIMWGPGIAAMAIWTVYGRSSSNKITFLGPHKNLSILFTFFPIMALLVFNIHEDKAEIKPFWPMIYYLIGIISSLGEEIGWRGYLQNELNHLPRIKSAIIIGVMWEFWHFTTRVTQGSFFQISLKLMLTYTILIIFSYFMGIIVNKTRSILVAASLHTWINLLIENDQKIYFSFLVCLPIWFLLLKYWDKSVPILSDLQD